MLALTMDVFLKNSIGLFSRMPLGRSTALMAKERRKFPHNEAVTFSPQSGCDNSPFVVRQNIRSVLTDEKVD
jgi:hypothetical protein